MTVHQQNDDLAQLLTDCAQRDARPVKVLVPDTQEPKLAKLLWQGKPVPVVHCGISRITLISRTNPET